VALRSTILVASSHTLASRKGAGAPRGVFFLSPKSGDGGGLTVFTGPFSNLAAAKNLQRLEVLAEGRRDAVRLPSGKSTPLGGFRRMHDTPGIGMELSARCPPHDARALVIALP
jgi:hypothetical protein